ncbi:hypothetical protein Hypma_013015 [Hypsizygus marmoreus]|uniref:Uncharacterized protein n=1 Tax=Hypsizygus marmoreus TaxID=39966 RepID=A0A369JF98_HYPMA|nr:hypothetical protein Hypma_013015 [Hypsizygus marmoreus]
MYKTNNSTSRTRRCRRQRQRLRDEARWRIHRSGICVAVNRESVRTRNAYIAGLNMRDSESNRLWGLNDPSSIHDRHDPDAVLHLGSERRKVTV